MEIKFMRAQPTLQERAAVEEALLPYAGRCERDLLLPALHGVNDRIGWISAGALNEICRRLDIPPAQAYGVASFYRLFSFEPRAPGHGYVCEDIACLANGAQEMLADGALQRSPCLGLCDRAPASTLQAEETAHVGGPVRRLLRRIEKIDPQSLDAYAASAGYAALRRSLETGPEAVIAAVSASQLAGRGGAAFPAGRKMEAVARAPAYPHYIVCNADESEPGAFKDRVLLEGDPFAVLEGMTIAGIAAGCERGFIYVRGEYTRAAQRMQHAVTEARRRGYLGENIMDRGARFDVEVRRGAGAYICGEESALFNSIEGKRGEPRSRPPFPAQRGLFGKPTLVNNVETLACIPGVVMDASAPTRLYCVSGTVRRAGVYELPLGATLRELLEYAGGVREGRVLRAVLLGGAAGTFVGPGRLDKPLPASGTGAVMVFDDTVDMRAIVSRIAAFFREESCGLCVPCRIGTVRQQEALRRHDGDALSEIAQVMRDASLCGLGQSAANAVQSALALGILGDEA